MVVTSIGTLRNASGFMQTVAGVVLVTFTTVTLSPSVHAMQQYASQQETLKQVAADDTAGYERGTTSVGAGDME